MCLAVPGRIEAIDCDNGIERSGRVSFGGVIRQVNLAYVPEARVGDYVVVHVGFAISVIDEREAALVFEYLRQIDELGEREGEPS
ncbi:MAG TPA: HypC/HybG/HupF family hydrogenase formation chaperone [Candidatus Kapabacteria bacterium]|jgi:hydrogenase expression/formation protein HypC|nr:HypC/HybG/HupF family hydrogenase formation chaperone [Candidatus Kapabacteria bacterium]HVK37707.1 HypC/HybG/HupF family hydrogenase formation chaperone [Candidatus Kapabacteria bacterium]